MFEWFYRGPEGPAVSITAAGVDSAAEVRIHIHATDPDPHPYMTFAERQAQRPMLPSLPSLHPPADAICAGGGGGGGPERWESTLRLWTDRRLAEIQRHYEDQLAAAGWRREAGDADGTVGWSSWSCEDEDAGAAFGDFLILQYPEPGGYTLIVSATSAERPEADQ